MTLVSPSDHYSSGFDHNHKFYTRPSDGRVLYMPWDHDFQSSSATSPLVRNNDLAKLIADPSRKRLFYGHLLNMIECSFNRTYMESWGTHYQGFATSGLNYSSNIDFIDTRSNFVLSQINADLPAVNFEITTNGGADFTTANPSVTLAGTGWANVRNIFPVRTK